jgi:hypothetical protein
MNTYPKKITYKSLELTVEYTYSKPEPMTREYPGCPEEYNIVTVYHGDILINDFIDEMDLWDEITEQLILEITGERR